MTIEDMIGAIGTSVQTAHKAIQLHSLSEFFDCFFEKKESNETAKNGEAVYKPKTLQISFPAGEEEKQAKTVTVPVAALVQHNNMDMDYVKIKLNVNITNESEDNLQVSSQPVKDSNVNGVSGEMEIMFKCNDTPEGVARIANRLHSLL